MNSIGSFFELNPEIFFEQDCKNSILNWNKNDTYKYKKYFNSGRSAIRYIFRNILKIGENEKVLIPSYLCEAIVQAINDESIKFEFYSIDENLNIDIDDLKARVNDNVKAIFFIQYFGFPQHGEIIEEIKNIGKTGVKIIEDLTQSIFTKKDNIGFGDYIIASIRKWFEVNDGAILASKKEFIDINIDNQDYKFVNDYFVAQILKNIAIKNNIDFKYRNYVIDAEKILNIDNRIRDMSNTSRIILGKYDLDKLKQRNKNYKYLYENLSEIEQIKYLYKYDKDIIPLGFPIKVNKRDELLRYLISYKIYCPIHWPIDKKVLDEFPRLKKLSEDILTIPCDQRYCANDMNYIVNRIKQFYSE